MSQRTKEEIAEIGRAVDARLCEFFDGYVIVGFIGDQPLTVSHTNPGDVKTQIALKCLLASAAQEPMGQ